MEGSGFVKGSAAVAVSGSAEGGGFVVGCRAVEDSGAVEGAGSAVGRADGGGGVRTNAEGSGATVPVPRRPGPFSSRHTVTTAGAAAS